MKRKLLTGLTLISIAIAPAAMATNLVQAFSAALKSDPAYKQAEAQYLSDKTQIAQARAGVLPTIDLQANLDRQNAFTGYNDQYPGAAGNSSQQFVSRGYTLAVTQPIFDWQAFKQIAQAKAAVQQSASTYAGSGQDLIVRLAQAYFNVLEAQDILRYSEAQKKALYRQYEVSRQRYRVGLDAITSLYKSQAAYDAAKAEYLADQNSLSNSKEELREITGNYYPRLKTLENNFPLVSPNPLNINQWVKTALEQNLDLRATRFGVMAAEENIKVQSSGNLPTLDAQASLQDAYLKSMNQGERGTKDTRTGEVGVALDFPVYAGGITGANTDQAEAQYQLAIAKMEGQYRATVANTRKSYLSVVSQISQVKADRQSIKSHMAAVESIQAGYQAGTQTILDVLQAQKDLFSAEKDYAQDRFAYLINTLKLKQSAGVLSPNDLTDINHWLTAENVVPHQKHVLHRIKTNKTKATHHATYHHHTTFHRSTAKHKTVAKKTTSTKTTKTKTTK